MMQGFAPPRLIVFQGVPGTLRGVSVAQPGPSRWPPLGTTETLDFSADFCEIVEPGATLLQVDAVVFPDGACEIAAARCLGTLVILTLTGAAAVDAAYVTMTVTTGLNSTQQITRSACLPIILVAPQPDPGGVLTLNGAILTIGDFTIPDGT